MAEGSTREEMARFISLCKYSQIVRCGPVSVWITFFRLRLIIHVIHTPEKKVMRRAGMLTASKSLQTSGGCTGTDVGRKLSEKYEATATTTQDNRFFFLGGGGLREEELFLADGSSCGGLKRSGDEGRWRALQITLGRESRREGGNSAGRPAPSRRALTLVKLEVIAKMVSHRAHISQLHSRAAVMARSKLIRFM